MVKPGNHRQGAHGKFSHFPHAWARLTERGVMVLSLISPLGNRVKAKIQMQLLVKRLLWILIIYHIFALALLMNVSGADLKSYFFKPILKQALFLF
jgi:hypothetical protein